MDIHFIICTTKNPIFTVMLTSPMIIAEGLLIAEKESCFTDIKFKLLLLYRVLPLYAYSCYIFLPLSPFHKDQP